MDLLAQMATFVRVVEAGHLSAAARALGLSLPAVSRQLRALEDELGVRLIVRTTRHLRVTEAGRRWHGHCTRILREVEEARHSVAPRGVRGRVVVSASVTLGMHFVLPKLPALLRAHPGLSLDLRLEDNPVDLVADNVDLVFRAGFAVPPSASLIARPLPTIERVAVAAPSYLRAHGVPRAPDALLGHEAILQLSAAGPLERWRFELGAEQREVTVHGRLRLTTPLAIRDAAVAGLGVAWLPDWLVATDLAAGRLRRILAKWRSPRVSAWVLYRVEARGSAVIRAVLERLALAEA